MKITDFTYEMRGMDASKNPIPWVVGSQSAKIGKGTLGGKKYQVKIHCSSPVWYNTDQKIKEKEAELKNATDPAQIEATENTLNNLKKKRDARNKADEISDKYVEYKNAFIKKMTSLNDKQLVFPVEFWKEEFESALVAVEAVPWVDNVAVGYKDDFPVNFNRDLTQEQQYDIIASLCDQVAKLHKANILHGDLKIGNTLITKSDDNKLVCTLIDFDASIMLDDFHAENYPDGAWMNVIGGTHFAPEHFLLNNAKDEDEDISDYEKSDLTTKADIFALGATIYEYFYGETDADHYVPMVDKDGKVVTTSPSDYARNMLRPDVKAKVNLPDSVPDLLYSAISWAMSCDPNERPTAEQLRDIFKNRNTDNVPSQFTRNPLWPEHQAQYELCTLPEGVTVKKGRKGWYVVKKSPTAGAVTWEISRLVEEGYATRIGETPSKDGGTIYDLWTADGTGKLPQCVTRAETNGYYYIYDSTVKLNTKPPTMVKYQKLVDLGYICTPEQKATLWPQDQQAGYKIVSRERIERNLAKGKGVGNYVVVMNNIVKSPKTTEQLAAEGRISKAIEIKLYPYHQNLYLAKPDALPADVESVTRGSLPSRMDYVVKYKDGRKETLTINDMLARGYVVKK